MLEEMSSHLLTEWMAYYNLEPFGNELIDIQLAKFQAMMASSKNDMKDSQKFRVWKKVIEVTEAFDPMKYYNDLKAAFGLKKQE